MFLRGGVAVDPENNLPGYGPGLFFSIVSFYGVEGPCLYCLYKAIRVDETVLEHCKAVLTHLRR